MSLVLWLWACTSGPALTGVEPGQVHPGERIEILGERLPSTGAPFVIGEGDPAPVALLAEPGAPEGRLRAQVPAGLPPGRYTVGVRAGETDALLPVALVVVPLPLDTPCSGAYTTNTQLSLAQKRIVLDRFHRNGERETVEVKLDDVQRVAHERVEHPQRGACEAIWLHTRDGRRLLFDDDAVVDLEPRARRVAASIGRPFGPEAGRPLGPEAGRPVGAEVPAP